MTGPGGDSTGGTCTYTWVMTRVGSRRAAARVLVGGALGGVLVLPRSVAAANPQTVDWRFCSKCRGLWRGVTGLSVCPAGGAHSARRSMNFTLFYGVPPTANDELGWEECDSCSGAFWANTAGENDPVGACPGNTSGHVYTGSRHNYLLEHDVPPESTEQGGWRYCTKCRGLFRPKGRKRGVCPAGGKHLAHPFKYNLDISARS